MYGVTHCDKLQSRHKTISTCKMFLEFFNSKCIITILQVYYKYIKWLNVNKLTLNIKKSNFVIFRPHQKSVNYHPVINMYDNNSKQYTPLECKEYIKYLGIIIDCHLSWKHRIDYIALKISKNVGIISKLRHFIPNHTLLDIYRSLILPLNELSFVWTGCMGKCCQGSHYETSYITKTRFIAYV